MGAIATSDASRSEDFIRQQPQGNDEGSGDLDWLEHTSTGSGDACIVQDGADLTEGLAFVPQ